MGQPTSWRIGLTSAGWMYEVSVQVQGFVNRPVYFFSLAARQLGTLCRGQDADDASENVRKILDTTQQDVSTPAISQHHVLCSSRTILRRPAFLCAGRVQDVEPVAAVAEEGPGLTVCFASVLI